MPDSKKIRGRWKPGQSGNPGGRVGVPKEVRELAREHTVEAIKALVKWTKSSNAAASVRAAEALLDRAWGRPQQSVEHSGKDGEPIKWDVKINLV